VGLFRVTLLDPVNKNALPIKLCDSGDPLPTLNVRLNHQPVFEFRNFANAAFAYALFHGNRRNLLSFEVTRRVDAADALFKSPALALAYSIKLTQVWPGLCVAKIEVEDFGGKGLFFLQNCAAQSCDLVKANGIRLGYQFALNGGKFTDSLNAV
jgi:hypothetical protein